MSRSTFAARFAAVVGRSPLRYLTDCRMRLARGLLTDTTLGMKAIARQSGYAGDA